MAASYAPHKKEECAGVNEVREMDRDDEVAHAFVFCDVVKHSRASSPLAHTPANGIGSSPWQTRGLPAHGWQGTLKDDVGPAIGR